MQQVEPFLEENLNLLRDSEQDGSLVRKMIGFQYAVTPQTIQNAITMTMSASDAGPAEWQAALSERELRSLLITPCCFF